MDDKQESKSAEQKIADAILTAVEDKEANIYERKSGLIVVGAKEEPELPGQYL